MKYRPEVLFVWVTPGRLVEATRGNGETGTASVGTKFPQLFGASGIPRKSTGHANDGNGHDGQVQLRCEGVVRIAIAGTGSWRHWDNHWATRWIDEPSKWRYRLNRRPLCSDPFIFTLLL